MKRTLVPLLLLTTVLSKTPNVLIFIADDLGYADIGSFGNTTLRTPNTDKLAKEGARLTHHLTSSALCTPSRTALLTGRYQSRSGMISPAFFGIILFLASSSGLPASEVTIAKLAKSKGYDTGLIGKWHLGWSESKYNDNVHHPHTHGFGYYYGHPLTNMRDWYEDGSKIYLAQNPYRMWINWGYVLAVMLPLYFLKRTGYVGSKLFYGIFAICCSLMGYAYFVMNNFTLLNSVLFRNFEIVEQPINLKTLSERYTKESIEFIHNNQKSDKPFLLVVSWDHVHTALMTSEKFRGKSKHSRYGDAVEELDYGTGQILSTLDQLGLTDDTFVYFTSDNGGHLEEVGIYGDMDGGYNYPLKGGKGQPVVDGGIRVPTIVRYPNHIPKNSEVRVPTTQMDMYTTIANLIQAEVPKDRIVDGKDIMPLLQQKEKVSPNEFMFHYCTSEIQAMRYIPRKGDKVWKLVFKEPNYIPGTMVCKGLACSCQAAVELDPPVLYEMNSDIGEQRPIPINSDKKYQDIADIMMKALEEHKKSIGDVNPELKISRLLWNPFLQPCCNFPSCQCSDPKYTGLQ